MFLGTELTLKEDLSNSKRRLDDLQGLIDPQALWVGEELTKAIEIQHLHIVAFAQSERHIWGWHRVTEWRTSHTKLWRVKSHERRRLR